MTQPIYIVDAFTDKPFAGNPAAVCPLTGEHERDAVWMQAVANEMNLSETAFVIPRPDGSWNLRWFTPLVEVDLCGHATLGSAHALWTTGHADPEQPLRFHTRSGELICTLRGTQIEMDFPACPAVAKAPVEGFAEALGSIPQFVGQNGMDILAVLDSEEIVRTLKPDINQLGQLPVRGVIVTAKADTPGLDFVSRFFAPQSGIAEDPVTGSAHCCLGPYWQSVLGKNELVGYQASQRGGTVTVRCVGNRVILGGSATLVLEGTLRV